MTSPSGENARCVACGGDLGFFGSRIGYDYFRCTRCASIQLVPQPSQEELDKAYKREYAVSGHIDVRPEEWTAAARTHYAAVSSTIRDHCASGKILDYGGGWGGLTEMLTEQGRDSCVIEPSDQMAAYCEQRGVAVTHGDIYSANDERYKVVALVGVFEHLIEHDAWLNKAHERLDEDGYFITMQPTALAAGFLGNLFRLGATKRELPALHQTFRPPWHTVLFSLEGMQTLVEAHGFRLVEIRPAPQGRAKGLTGLVQRLLQAVNTVGWLVGGRRWPLVITHIFVFERVPVSDAESDVLDTSS